MATTTMPEIGELLHRINEGATNSQTPLGEVMRLCLRLGKLLDNKELSDWAKAEAGGYASREDLPDYRIFNTEVRGTFFGLGGSSLRNTIPQFFVEDAHRDTLFKIHILQPVGELERIASRSTDPRISIPWPADVVMYYQRKEIYEGYVLAAAERTLTTETIAGVLEVIRSRVLEFVLVIEEELGIDIMDYDNDKKPLEASILWTTTTIKSL